MSVSFTVCRVYKVLEQFSHVEIVTLNIAVVHTSCLFIITTSSSKPFLIAKVTAVFPVFGDFEDLDRACVFSHSALARGLLLIIAHLFEGNWELHLERCCREGRLMVALTQELFEFAEQLVWVTT